MFRLSLLLLLINTEGTSQPTQWLKLDVLSDSIRIDSCHKLEIDYTVENTSEMKLTCYRLDSRIGDANTGRLELFCDPGRVGAGLVFSVVDGKNQFKSGTYNHVVQNTPVTPQMVDSLMAIAQKEAINSSVTLKRNELRSMRQVVDLTPLKLTKGIYYFQLIYYSGKKVESLLGEQRLLYDDKKSPAAIYQGCTISNKVVLVVD